MTALPLDARRPNFLFSFCFSVFGSASPMHSDGVVMDTVSRVDGVASMVKLRGEVVTRLVVVEKLDHVFGRSHNTTPSISTGTGTGTGTGIRTPVHSWHLGIGCNATPQVGFDDRSRENVHPSHRRWLSKVCPMPICPILSHKYPTRKTLAALPSRTTRKKKDFNKRFRRSQGRSEIMGGSGTNAHHVSHSNNGIDGVMGWDWDSQLRFASVPSASLSALSVGLQSIS
ncbi:hypothetical protein BGY98DRAFT_935297 [Russula aff. rugulosa BPL654]|nr:hypothetical protein BGY98DRAFT_935297 [Russula aff. rugulosa BPL654]